jgi:hypothetical protein
MVHPPSLLNSRQHEVLQWIADGCPDRVMDGYSYKTSAVALRSRRLVTVSKNGGIWRASITSTGAYYLEHGDYPTDREIKTASSTSVEVPVRSGMTPDKSASSSPPPARSGRPGRSKIKTKKADGTLSPTERLIADLVANGGELRLGRIEGDNYEARIRAAIRFGKVPEGKQLVTTGWRWSDDYAIRLQDAPAWMNAKLVPITVPTVLRKPHPLVASLQRRDSALNINRSARHRALLVIQALAVEAERRGYTVKETEVTTDQYGYKRRESKDHFAILVQGHPIGVQVRQDVNRNAHEPTARELVKADRDTWFRLPKYDYTPSERLSIQLSGRSEHRQSKWKDATKARLEELLPQILQEIELRAAAAEVARLAAIEAAEERRRQWELARKEAELEHRESYRAQVLGEQVDDWLRSRQIRDYLDAMQMSIATFDDPADAAAANEWLEWARHQTSTLDPLQRSLVMPVEPSPTAEDLAPFMNGLSPYGPSGLFG